ncbi:MAG: NAD(P)-dependent oxidoreductase [Gammaproteobacteria bacterium]|nr:NAD(P)-dependent oxidoreductase [Gammaproteobacteria bacterium]
MSKTKRIIVLGGSGFIGHKIVSQLKARDDNIEILAPIRNDIDLTADNSATKLASLFTHDTVLIFAAAIKRQSADDAIIFQKNNQMVINVLAALSKVQIEKIIYLSSAAIYGEDIENLSINEDTNHLARSYYGLSKLTAEWLLRSAVDNGAAKTLCLLRPPMIYGADEVIPSYGPSLFLDKAISGNPLTLWGDGTELREFIYIDDIADIICQAISLDINGPLNIVQGLSVSFRDVLDTVKEVAGSLPPLEQRARSKNKVDNVFDPSHFFELFPGFKFTSLTQGLKQMLKLKTGNTGDKY